MARWNTSLVNFPVLMLMSMTLMLYGCAAPFFGGYGTKGQTKEEFTRYVEGVFRLENSMTSEIMALPETDDAHNHGALSEAEQHMEEACAPLNEYVSRESEGLSVSFFLSRRVEKSANDCEQAAQKVKSLLTH